MTKNFPPHLPAKSCSVPLHRWIRSIWVIIFIVCISFFAGITGALVSDAWISPTPLGFDTGLQFARQAPVGATLGQSTQQHVSQRIFTIVDTRKKIEDTYITQSSIVGEAVILSSDGWSAYYAPSYVAGGESFWELVDQAGNVYEIESTTYDAVHDMLYIKANAHGLRVSKLLPVEQINNGATVFTYVHNNWQEVQLHQERSELSGSAAPIDTAMVRMNVLQPAPSGAIVVNEQGALVGFVSTNNTIVSASHILAQLSSVLQEGVLIRQSFPWYGQFVEDIELEGSNQKTTGFFVQRTMDKRVDIRSGDIILSIAGETIDPLHARLQLLLAPAELSLRILRDGEPIDILVDKQLFVK